MRCGCSSSEVENGYLTAHVAGRDRCHGRRRRGHRGRALVGRRTTTGRSGPCRTQRGGPVRSGTRAGGAQRLDDAGRRGTTLPGACGRHRGGCAGGGRRPRRIIAGAAPGRSRRFGRRHRSASAGLGCVRAECRARAADLARCFRVRDVSRPGPALPRRFCRASHPPLRPAGETWLRRRCDEVRLHQCGRQRRGHRQVPRADRLDGRARPVAGGRIGR